MYLGTPIPLIKKGHGQRKNWSYGHQIFRKVYYKVCIENFVGVAWFIWMPHLFSKIRPYTYEAPCNHETLDEQDFTCIPEWRWHSWWTPFPPKVPSHPFAILFFLQHQPFVPHQSHFPSCWLHFPQHFSPLFSNGEPLTSATFCMIQINIKSTFIVCNSKLTVWKSYSWNRYARVLLVKLPWRQVCVGSHNNLGNSNFGI